MTGLPAGLGPAIFDTHATALILDRILEDVSERVALHPLNGHRVVILPEQDWAMVERLAERLAADVVRIEVALFGVADATGGRYANAGQDIAAALADGGLARSGPP